MGRNIRYFLLILGFAAYLPSTASAQFWIGPAESCSQLPGPQNSGGCHKDAQPNAPAALGRWDAGHGGVEAQLARRTPPRAQGFETPRASREISWPDAPVVVPRNMLQATYDRPMLPGSGLTLLGSSAVADRPAPHHADTWHNVARSNLGLAFNAYGFRLTANPELEGNWGMHVVDHTRYSVTTQLDTDLLQDISLSLYSRYDRFSFGEDWADYTELRKFATLSYDLGDGYIVSLAAREIGGRNHWENWSLTGPALKLALPVADRLVVTLDNELLSSDRLFHDGYRPRTGFHHNHKLEANWRPSAFARHALQVIASYTLHHDTAAERAVAYHNILRAGLTMRF